MGLTAQPLRRWRVQLLYWWRHGKLADLEQPRLLTEHIQRRKLEDHDPRFPKLADKVAVKEHVDALLGPGWAAPTLWRGSVLPAEPCWPMPFVVKSRHGCGHVRIVRNEGDYRLARRRSRRWMRSRYGRWLDEWLYQWIPHGLLVETFLGKGPCVPIDYKLFVFGGRVRYIQVHLDRETRHRWIVFDLDWNRVSPADAEADPPPPVSLKLMTLAAEKLGEDFDFVRADFYEIEGRPMFGELTFYPGSGLEAVEPANLDAEMGAWWSQAREPDDHVHGTAALAGLQRPQPVPNAG